VSNSLPSAKPAASNQEKENSAMTQPDPTSALEGVQQFLRSTACPKEPNHAWSPPDKPHRKRWLKGKGYKCGQVITPTRGMSKGIPQTLLCENHADCFPVTVLCDRQ
jgi:hypothetical protein